MIKRSMLLLTVAALVTVMMAVSAPLASATPAPGKDACKNGGYQALGFDDQSQCVEAANQAAKAGEPFPPPEEECPPPDPGISCETPEEPGDPIEVCPPGTIGFPPICIIPAD